MFLRESDIDTFQCCKAGFNKQNTAMWMMPVILETANFKILYIQLFSDCIKKNIKILADTLFRKKHAFAGSFYPPLTVIVTTLKLA